MFNERELVVRSSQVTGSCRGKRHHPAEAHFVDHDEDSSADVLIDPLDERESRCALTVRRP